jgi:putative ABC transport system permease protein
LTTEDINKLKECMGEEEWEKFQAAHVLSPDVSGKLWNGIHKNSGFSRARYPYFRWAAVAASVLLVVGVSWYFIVQRRKASAAGAETVAIAKNNTPQTMALTLSDGSAVELSPDSKLSYSGSAAKGAAGCTVYRIHCVDHRDHCRISADPVRQDRPIGYERNGLIRIMMNTPDLTGKYDVLQKELLSSGGAIGFAESSSAATENNYYDDRFEWEGKNVKTHGQSFALTAVTPEYAGTVGWRFEEGRNFSRSLMTDAGSSASNGAASPRSSSRVTNAGSVILNEAAVKYMGLPSPVGKMIRWNGRPFTVVGVIKDMVKGSPYMPAQQGLFFMAPEIGPEITIRLNPQISIAAAIGKIEPIFKRLNPSSPFSYAFVDDEYAHKFAAEQRIGTLSEIFAMLAVFISCLGIFGLASFVAEQRVKEIGIRKVLGASVFNIWQLFSKDFVVLVLAATVIAVPVAWYVAHNWLEGYQYRTALSWWIFLMAGMGVLLLTLLTVSIQSIKAAIANPVKSLRSE